MMRVPNCSYLARNIAVRRMGGGGGGGCVAVVALC